MWLFYIQPAEAYANYDSNNFSKVKDNGEDFNRKPLVIYSKWYHKPNSNIGVVQYGQ